MLSLWSMFSAQPVYQGEDQRPFPFDVMDSIDAVTPLPICDCRGPTYLQRKWVREALEQMDAPLERVTTLPVLFRVMNTRCGCQVDYQDLTDRILLLIRMRYQGESTKQHDELLSRLLTVFSGEYFCALSSI